MSKKNKYTSSKTFLRAKDLAEGVLKDKTRLKSLLDSTTEKVGDINTAKEKYRTFSGQIKTAIRMVKAYSKGEYKEIPWKTILSVVAGLLYFIMPLDFIPDFIPFAGFVDDLSVILWIFNKFRTDVTSFQDWEEAKVVESQIQVNS